VIINCDSLYIGGTWTRGDPAAMIEVTSASTGERIGSVAGATDADVDAAVAAARRAFEDPAGWAQWEPAARATAMESLAAELERLADEMARRVSAQNGMPIAFSRVIEGSQPVAVLRYMTGLLTAEESEQEVPSVLGGKLTVRREPTGVIAAIAPWNYPQTLASFKYAPAIAAGCTVVLKPPPETLLDAMLLAEAVAASQIPPGVINIVPGGRETGAGLVRHPGVDKVAFTGSAATGRQIAETCGRLLRPVTLELGGKSAAIILDDADLDLGRAGQDLFGATLLNNGQTCYLSTRVLAPAARYDEVVEAFAALASGLTVGDALDPATQVGPMVSEAHRERVEGFIAEGKSDGARLVTGGGRPAGLDAGWFVQPTVFADVDNRSAMAQEEIFGPVLAVIRYRDTDDAVRIANESRYGLAGTVWTSDRERAMAVARRVRTGTIGINGYIPDPGGPFGGVKDSGIGRELGPGALAAYQQCKTIYG
jgi:aldehyde dehydrogenase (NAD+)